MIIWGLKGKKAWVRPWQTKSIATPSGWDASPTQVNPLAFRQIALTVRQYPFTDTPAAGWREAL